MSMLINPYAHGASGVGGGGGTLLATRTWDTNDYDGIVNWFGTNQAAEAFSNPARRTTGERMALGYSSANGASNVANVTSGADDEFVTTNTVNQWVSVYFGAGSANRVVALDRWAIKSRSTTANDMPRNFKLQGIEYGGGGSWVDIESYSGVGPGGANAWWSDAISDTRQWHALRLFQTGTNSSGNNYLSLGELEFWGDIYEVTDVPSIVSIPSYTDLAYTTGLHLWLKGDELAHELGVDQAAAFRWTDAAGNSNHGTANPGPRLRHSRINGFPAIHYYSASFQHVLPDLSALTEAEAFLVLKSNGGNPGLWTTGTSGSSSHWPFSGSIYDDFGRGGRFGPITPATDPLTWSLYNPSSESGAWVARQDGSTIHSSGSNTPSFPSSPRLGNSVSATFNGEVAELILFDHVLASADRDTVETYIADKYGLTIA